ncbi:cytochrome P450 2A11-like [Spea bombifrons]|uniref:cytochrome P450 2A11-like n=1 Tax=Spea bombifrons TaxID=233779 RepID=UPI00234B53DB|nr:cytochrome P450 2A11-like [Spea bombifrons]
MFVSEDVSLLLSLCLSCLILIFSLKMILGKSGNLPPGPKPLPLLGNYLQLRKGDLLKTLQELREKYGDVYTIYMGPRPVVVMSGYKTVKEVLVDRADDFLARGDIPTFDSSYQNYGIAFTSDMHRWRELRRFSLATLRGFGMGKRSIEDRIQEEAACLVAELKKTKEVFLDPRTRINKAPGNVIFSLMFGNRHEYDDQELLNVLDIMYQTFLTVSSPWGQLYDMFPRVMRHVPGHHQHIFHNMEKLLLYVEDRVKQNQKTLDPSNPRDYVDTFLIRMEKEKMDPESEFTLRNLVFSTLQIFFAGVETMSTTLTYGLLILLKYPLVVGEVHKEIDRVIGRNRSPNLQDRSRMPYTEAVIHEIQRFVDLVPFGIPRKTTKDVEFHGYTIPKDTNIFPMLTTALKDPDCFPYPTEFNPQNFLDRNGQFVKNDAFMPLAAGKRICLGEALVRMELFLFLVTILQNFSFKSPGAIEEVDVTPQVTGLGSFPKPYKMAFIPR